MIMGHLGVALAARGYWRRAPLFWLLAASLAPDAWDSVLAVAGVCNPFGLYSHTGPAVALLAAIAGGFVFLLMGGGSAGRSAGLVAVAMVLVHSPLDYLTGNKLFWPGGEMHGLRLYERPVIDFALETSLLLGGWFTLRRDPRAPALATSWIALVLAIALQGAADLSPRKSLKMSACEGQAVVTPQP